ncbi:hypothetical protein T09_8921 [Trichinella sp. T9]|nr:hypothetical protein T09_8921 [Trichinella sp. T9]
MSEGPFVDEMKPFRIQSSFSAGSTHSFRCLNPFGERWFKFFNLQRIPKRFLNHSHDPFPISTYPWSSFRDVSPFYAVCFCNAIYSVVNGFVEDGTPAAQNVRWIILCCTVAAGTGAGQLLDGFKEIFPITMQPFLGLFIQEAVTFSSDQHVIWSIINDNCPPCMHVTTVPPGLRYARDTREVQGRCYYCFVPC